MQEITILLGSLAGIATAAAMRRRPKIRLQSLGASSQIRSEITSLKIERDILTKTISRLYDSDSIPSGQKNKLLSKYQHQLGIILARVEKLEQASEHPDLGPVGDGLITLMDQKLSRLDERLYEISSKIASQTHIESTDVQSEPNVKPEVQPKSIVQPNVKPKMQIETQLDVQSKASNIQTNVPSVQPNVQTAMQAKSDNTRTGPRQSFEITTLTNISQVKTDTPQKLEHKIDKIDKKYETKIIPEIPKIKKDDIKHEIVSTVVPGASIPKTSEDIKVQEKPKVTEEVQPKKQDESIKKLKDEAKNIDDTTDDDPFDNLDDDALDDISLEDMQKNIAKILSDLDQAEVE